MITEQKRQEEPPKTEQAPAGAATTGREMPSLAAYALPAALAVSILANCVGVVYFRSLAQASRASEGREIPLGEYRFEAEGHEVGQVTRAEFCLHVELVRQAEKPGRQMLQAHHHRVRQNVEQLLRMAHGGDFNDPSLKGLKSQLQDQINKTLGIRAVSEVIVTDLRLERRPRREGVASDAGEPVPWLEPLAG